jgi:hypothetical protein
MLAAAYGFRSLILSSFGVITSFGQLGVDQRTKRKEEYLYVVLSKASRARATKVSSGP